MPAQTKPELRIETSDGAATLAVSGPLNKNTLRAIWPQTQAALARPGAKRLTLDMAQTCSADTSAAAYLLFVKRQAREKGLEVEVKGVPQNLQSLLSLIREDDLDPLCRWWKREGVFEAIGGAASRILADVYAMLVFVGEITFGLASALRHPTRVRWRDTLYYMNRVGADALPISALISFLVGFILAFLGFMQSHQYGADVFIADLVAYGMVRVFGPLMIAILCAGRSGSAFASEIGAMKIAEEVDALDTMGLERARFLIVPKMLALLTMMPILVLFANLAGIAGGFFIGVFGMGLSAPIYVQRTVQILTVWRIASGLVKCLVFAVLIGGIGCLRGFQTRQGPQAVGEVTTSAVVSGLFLIVCVEAVFAVVYHYLGL